MKLWRYLGGITKELWAGSARKVPKNANVRHEQKRHREGLKNPTINSYDIEYRDVDQFALSRASVQATQEKWSPVRAFSLWRRAHKYRTVEGFPDSDARVILSQTAHIIPTQFKGFRPVRRGHWYKQPVAKSLKNPGATIWSASGGEVNWDFVWKRTFLLM